MADFVEREKIQEAISDIYKDADNAVEGACIEIWSRVKEIPAADVRPVVTCADCKHWARIKKDCILASCDLDALVRCEDFYCANGEKREES